MDSTIGKLKMVTEQQVEQHLLGIALFFAKRRI